jgi:hypothetical protein
MSSPFAEYMDAGCDCGTCVDVRERRAAMLEALSISLKDEAKQEYRRELDRQRAEHLNDLAIVTQHRG